METTKILEGIIKEASTELVSVLSKNDLNEEDLNGLYAILQKHWKKAKQFMSYDAFVNQITAQLNITYNIPSKNLKYIHLWD